MARKEDTKPQRLRSDGAAMNGQVQPEPRGPDASVYPLGGELSREEVLPGLLPSETGKLRPEEVGRLWEVFEAIASTWGDPDGEPRLQRSQWLEFLEVRTAEAPSYLEEYRSAIRVLDELRENHGDQAMKKLLFESGMKEGDAATTRLAHLKMFVVDEFIRVWLASGGFKVYGAGNYNGYISGSRFAVRPAYRGLVPPAEVSSSPPAPSPSRDLGDGESPDTIPQE